MKKIIFHELIPPAPRSFRDRLYGYVRIALYTGMVVGIVACLALAQWLRTLGFFDHFESEMQALRDYQSKDSSYIYDKNGDLIYEFHNDFHVFTPIKKIPIQLINAIIATEDNGFYQHQGYDLKGMLRAFINNLDPHAKVYQGASTISQQVARNYFLNAEKTYGRKIKELGLAIEIERNFTKNKILELYLNSIFLGSRSYGVAAAAETYFGKPLEKLELHENAIIAGLIQAPSRYNPFKSPGLAKKRQLHVLKAMLSSGFINQDEYYFYSHKKLVYASRPVNSQRSYFVDYIINETGRIFSEDRDFADRGLRIYTSLDPRVQSLSTQSEANFEPLLRKAAMTMKGSRQLDPLAVELALLVIDNSRGEIVAMLGGRDYERSQFNRAIEARRATGSAFKPIVYSYGLTKGMRWNEVTNVVPINIDGYRPKNVSSDYYLNETTLFRAFYKSINTPVIELAQKYGIHGIRAWAANLGVSSQLRNELGTAIGASESSLLDMAHVYSAFANHGKLIQTTAIRKITNRLGKVLYQANDITERSAVVMTPEIADSMTVAMQAVFKYGTAAGHAELASFAAGKTGTTDDSRDTWFCGYTKDYTVIAWVGVEKEGQLSTNFMASSLALPFWAKVTKGLLDISGWSRLEYSPNLVLKPVHPQYGYQLATGVMMPFIKDDATVISPSPVTDVVSSSRAFRNIFR